MLFVKGFSKNFFIIFSFKHHHRAVDFTHLCGLTFNRGFCYLSFPLDIYIIAHSVLFVKRFLKFLQNLFALSRAVHCFAETYLRPLDTYIVSHYILNVNSFLKTFSICVNCPIKGFKIFETLCNFSLDKMRGMWYNGNAGQAGP